MREILIVAVTFAVLAGLAFAVRFVSEPSIFEAAWLTMVVLSLVAVVAEVVYFAALYVALRANGDIPNRWYARSFEHHRKLTPRQRWIVLPWFTVGFLGLTGALIIAVLLVFASIGVFRGLPKTAG